MSEPKRQCKGKAPSHIYIVTLYDAAGGIVEQTIANATQRNALAKKYAGRDWMETPVSWFLHKHRKGL